MQLYRLLIVNLLTWGIPAIPSYYTYIITSPYVDSADSIIGQYFALLAVFIIMLVANYVIFWGEYYHKYLTEEPEPVNKEKKKFV